ncbi:MULTISPECIES: DUF5672 family protein [Olivibacter]|uniref:DUF5672 domain-containing protein n=2 Tax=Sphingobacteriaceae TaxID=84566 RepID=F4C587_SPHS2|nr:DUF5672 family protein [Olivibacter sp. 47]MCL4639448.1 hypothetical protein [Olivibacter sp. UJ_SKK_5.1]MDM8176985.1 DUF5672 family protein [Olivibacter sp. 47]MDX3912481.1 DUF5672 family protein [Pseudosphingobacterium sp.]
MKIAVVIPIYKELADPDEKYAFWQCVEVLGSYPIILAAPHSLNTTYYENLADKPVTIQRFDDSFFKSVTGYSKLLTGKYFYEAFQAYDYILIYQLDAWVFRDELSAWAEKGYDYVGAPWLEPPPITSGKKPIINLSKRLVNKVGNGGLSLRKIKSHIKWSFWATWMFRLLPKNEDMIWTLFVPFKKPKAREALSFAFERKPRQSYELTGHHLPFGCHAWNKYQPDFWQQFIKKY